MPISYSSEQFFQDWRYAIKQDLTTSEGAPFPYAENGKQEWGDEVRKLTFGDEKANNSCISTDGKSIAVAVNQDIHMIDTKTWETITVLKGHISRVTSLAFKANDRNILVSSEENNYGRYDPSVKQMIHVWNIHEHVKHPSVIDDEEALRDVGVAAAKTAVSKLADLTLNLSEKEIKELEDAMTPVVTRIAKKHSVANMKKIHGRLPTSFQSNIFSPSGACMIYLPGQSPPMNGNAPWDAAVCSTEDDYSTKLILKGHTDGIMWTGWSADETLIATVAWDQTARIWDASTGEEKYKFKTENQNWTGAFSKDSKYFAFTCGNGTLQVIDLSDGSIRWDHKPEGRAHWRRSLAWHPEGRFLAVGGDDDGELLLLDVDEQKTVQRRQLSAEASNPDDEEIRGRLARWTDVSKIVYADNGKKLAIWTTGDASVELYDLKNEVKWRFARGGTDDGPKSSEWRDENGKVTSKGGFGMLVWEGEADGGMNLASHDFDGLRIWSTVPKH